MLTMLTIHRPVRNVLLLVLAAVLSLQTGYAGPASPSPPSAPAAYPPAVDPAKVGTYPPMSKSGGGYFYDDVLEYRVWVHRPEGGDDDYKAFATHKEAEAFSKATTGAEPPLVLIRQREWIDEPKPGTFIPETGERITEWQVQWLEGTKRRAESIQEFIRTKKAH
jgi:hypothetical protein